MIGAGQIVLSNALIPSIKAVDRLIKDRLGDPRFIPNFLKTIKIIRRKLSNLHCRLNTEVNLPAHWNLVSETMLDALNLSSRRIYTSIGGFQKCVISFVDKVQYHYKMRTSHEMDDLNESIDDLNYILMEFFKIINSIIERANGTKIKKPYQVNCRDFHLMGLFGLSRIRRKGAASGAQDDYELDHQQVIERLRKIGDSIEEYIRVQTELQVDVGRRMEAKDRLRREQMFIGRLPLESSEVGELQMNLQQKINQLENQTTRMSEENMGLRREMRMMSREMSAHREKWDVERDEFLKIIRGKDKFLVSLFTIMSIIIICVK